MYSLSKDPFSKIYISEYIFVLGWNEYYEFILCKKSKIHSIVVYKAQCIAGFHDILKAFKKRALHCVGLKTSRIFFASPVYCNMTLPPSPCTME